MSQIRKCENTCGCCTLTWRNAWQVIGSEVDADVVVGKDIAVCVYLPGRLIIDAPELETSGGVAGVG